MHKLRIPPNKAVQLYPTLTVTGHWQWDHFNARIIRHFITSFFVLPMTDGYLWYLFTLCYHSWFERH